MKPNPLQDYDKLILIDIKKTMDNIRSEIFWESINN